MEDRSTMAHVAAFPSSYAFDIRECSCCSFDFSSIVPFEFFALLFHLAYNRPTSTSSIANQHPT